MVRDAMREFAAHAVRPIARECDEASGIPHDFFQSVWDLGLTSTQIPASYGGGGEERSAVTNAIVLEELAFGDATLATAALAPSGFANAIADFGTEEQQRELLPLFCTEKFHAASLAVVEPAAIFDASNPRTLAEAKDDVFVISGAKTLVPLGHQASHFLVTARNSERLDAFVIPRDAEGLTIGEVEKNLGLKALSTVSLELERVEVPQSARLGGDAGADVRRMLDGSRAALCAVMVGVSRAVLEYCIPYAKDRVAFGEAIAKKQAIAFRVSDMRIETDAMRFMTWKAASHLEKGLDVTRQAHLARSYCAEKSLWTTDNGIQTLGGHGFIREHPVEMWFRNARSLGVMEGTLAL
jgi:alkylation response protein AidB-like acyl-CoA dehydrogenase